MPDAPLISLPFQKRPRTSGGSAGSWLGASKGLRTNNGSLCVLDLHRITTYQAATRLRESFVIHLGQGSELEGKTPFLADMIVGSYADTSRNPVSALAYLQSLWRASQSLSEDQEVGKGLELLIQVFKALTCMLLVAKLGEGSYGNNHSRGLNTSSQAWCLAPLRGVVKAAGEGCPR